MRLYRKITPKIAQEIIATLIANECVEIEAQKKDEAAIDLAAVMVEYLNTLDEIEQEANELAQRRGISKDRMHQVRDAVAERKNVKLGDAGIEYVLDQVREALLVSKNVEEVFADDLVLRKTISDVFKKFASVDEEIDRDARKRIKNRREGTAEWDIEYNRTVAQLKRQRGLV